MARIRTLKPEFFRSRSLAECSIPARLTFMGLWTEADDHGRGVADAHVLKGALWPLNDEISPEIVEEHLQELAADRGSGAHIRLYEARGRRYFEIRNWKRHQSAQFRRGRAVHPAPRGRPSASGGVQFALDGVQDAAEVVLELGTGNWEQGEAAPSARKRDPFFDALVELFGEATTRSRAAFYGKTAREFKEAGVTAEEILARGRLMATKDWKDAGPGALAKHWDELVPGKNGAKPGRAAGRVIDFDQRKGAS